MAANIESKYGAKRSELIRRYGKILKYPPKFTNDLIAAANEHGLARPLARLMRTEVSIRIAKQSLLRQIDRIESPNPSQRANTVGKLDEFAMRLRIIASEAQKPFARGPLVLDYLNRAQQIEKLPLKSRTHLAAVRALPTRLLKGWRNTP